jgi:hypothetical protein
MDHVIDTYGIAVRTLYEIRTTAKGPAVARLTSNTPEAARHRYSRNSGSMAPTWAVLVSRAFPQDLCQILPA